MLQSHNAARLQNTAHSEENFDVLKFERVADECDLVSLEDISVPYLTPARIEDDLNQSH